MGPVPLPGRALRQRHAHPGLLLPALDRPEVHRRRAVDPGLPARHGGRGRHRRPHPLRPQGAAGRVVERRRPLDGRRRAHRHRRGGHPHLWLPVHVLGLLPLPGRLHAGLPGPRPLRRRGRAPPAVARGPRRRRQAGAGDRVGGHGHDPRPGPHRAGRPGHHAPALPHLRRVPPGPRCPRQRPAPVPARPVGLLAHPLEEHQAPGAGLPQDPHRPRCGQGPAARDGPQGAGRGLRRRHPLHPHLRPVGPAPVPGAQQRSLRRHPLGAGHGGDRPHRHLDRGRHRPALRRGARGRHHRHRHRPPDGDPRRGGLRGRRGAGRLRPHLDLQGPGLLRGAQPGVDVRLRQRVVDAAGRPQLRVRLPPAQPHARHRDRHVHPRACAPRTATCPSGRGSTTSPPATCSA